MRPCPAAIGSHNVYASRFPAGNRTDGARQLLVWRLRLRRRAAARTRAALFIVAARLARSIEPQDRGARGHSCVQAVDVGREDRAHCRRDEFLGCRPRRSARRLLRRASVGDGLGALERVVHCLWASGSPRCARDSATTIGGKIARAEERQRAGIRPPGTGARRHPRLRKRRREIAQRRQRILAGRPRRSARAAARPGLGRKTWRGVDDLAGTLAKIEDNFRSCCSRMSRISSARAERSAYTVRTHTRRPVRYSDTRPWYRRVRQSLRLWPCRRWIASLGRLWRIGCAIAPIRFRRSLIRSAHAC